MGKISENKIKIRHKEWAAMVSKCQASGRKVEEWCAENSIKVSPYYKRLNVLRSELIEGNEKQSIVPVSVSAAITNADNNVTENAAKLGGGRRRDRLKALLWEGDGFIMLYKRLENGHFNRPHNEQEIRNLTRE